MAFFPFGTGRCRVVADLGPARGTGRPPDPSLAEVQAVVDQRGPGGLRLSDPVWLAGEGLFLEDTVKVTVHAQVQKNWDAVARNYSLRS